MHNVRPGVSHFKGDVLKQFVLHGKVPLLHITRSQGAVDRKHSLPQASIRREGNGRNGRFTGKNKRGVNVIEGLLGYCLQKRELRRSKWSGDSGLLDPNQTVARADDRLILKQIGQPYARSKIKLVQLAGCIRKAILAKEIEFLRLQIENCSLVVRFFGGKIQRVAHACIHREPARGLPVVLNEVFLNMGTRPDGFGLQVDLKRLDLTQQKTGYGISRCGGRGRAGRIIGEKLVELKLARRIRRWWNQDSCWRASRFAAVL